MHTPRHGILVVFVPKDKVTTFTTTVTFRVL